MSRTERRERNKRQKKVSPLGVTAISGLVSGATRAFMDYLLEKFIG